MRLRRPSDAPATEPITPLIDVVFFLLVFFLLVGRMDATAPFEVSPPINTAHAQNMPGGGLTVSISATGDLALDGTATTREAILAAARDPPSDLIRLNAHGAAPLGVLLPLADALAEAGADHVVLVVTPGAP